MSPPTDTTGKRAPEKSKFLQTCNRLSLFLKENSKIRDLNIGINAKFNATITGVLEARTIDLLSSIDDSSEKTDKSTNVPPQYVILDSSMEVENPTNKASSSKLDTKPKTSQMTIFYGGKVMVLDDVPADRARDLMLMAQKDCVQPKPNEKTELASTSKPSLGLVEPQAKDLDLPIARRASLHKFLAKRKDRATVRAVPYQVHNQSPRGSSSGNEPGFDLNCNP